MNPSIIPFVFGELPLRAIDLEGETFFVAIDICTILGLDNPTRALASLEEDELTLLKVRAGGQDREMNAVTEAGLYRLIFKSRKTEARAFQRFVFHEVLPAIRRTGSYGSHHQNYLALIKDQIALGVSPDLAAKNALALSPDRKDLPLIDPKTEPVLPEMAEELLQYMTPGVEYTITGLASYLTRRHPAMRSKTLASNCSSIGKLMEKARQLGRVDKVPGRNASYLRLPDVIDIAEGR